MSTTLRGRSARRLVAAVLIAAFLPTLPARGETALNLTKAFPDIAAFSFNLSYDASEELLTARMDNGPVGFDYVQFANGPSTTFFGTFTLDLKVNNDGALVAGSNNILSITSTSVNTNGDVPLADPLVKVQITDFGYLLDVSDKIRAIEVAGPVMELATKENFFEDTSPGDTFGSIINLGLTDPTSRPSDFQSDWNNGGTGTGFGNNFAPEPTSLAVFLALGGALLARRRIRVN